MQAGDTRPIHVYIRAGLTSLPAVHCHWSKLLTDKGALVDGSFHFPTARELATTDVMVMYKGDAGHMTASERQVMEDYLERGGGLISIHDTLCGDDPQYYSTIVGGSKLHGERNFSSGAIKYTVADKASPIMKGISDFEINDEAFFKITWAKSPEVKVLATAPMPAGGEVVPQMWTYERTIFGAGPRWRTRPARSGRGRCTASARPGAWRRVGGRGSDPRVTCSDGRPRPGSAVPAREARG